MGPPLAVSYDQVIRIENDGFIRAESHVLIIHGTEGLNVYSWIYLPDCAILQQTLMEIPGQVHNIAL